MTINMFMLIFWIFSTDAPIVTLQLGAKLNPNDIEEGDDVYFECIVKSNPPVYKVVWEHDVSRYSYHKMLLNLKGLPNKDNLLRRYHILIKRSSLFR